MTGKSGGFPSTRAARKCAVVVAGLMLSCANAYAQSAFVRVNQLGYLSSSSKRAYLMASAVETGATFSVKNSSGATVYSAAIGANLGSWSTAYPDVYALDFSTVTLPGTYTITVSGPIAAASPGFKIDTGANVYSVALANSLYFYENERDGPNFIATSLRTAPGHVNDQSAKVYLTPNVNNNGRFSGDLTATGAVIDASGGWWDAGDYLKFVQTTSYTVALLQIGVRDFPNQMGAGSTTSNFTAEATFGVDWLLKMWDDNNKTFYYQVGIGNGNSQTVSDHDIWRLPQADDTYQGCTSRYRYICHRPVFINTAGGAGAKVSPNLAGRMAAVFALCYHTYQSSNPTLANQCLLSAEHIFDLANTAPSGNLLTVIPFSFYPESEWRDDLELGATELYFALQAASNLPTGLPHTDPTYYLQQAATWANAYITGPNDAADTLNLYDVTGLAHFELYRAMTLAGNPTGLATTKAALLADLKKQLDKAVTQGNTEPFGFGFPWNTYDTTSHGAGLSVMAAEYTNISGSNAYADYANRWLGNILGANAWGTSLIVNDGSTFPLCMQHQVTNLVPVPPNGPPFLSGAAVEGPNSITAKGTLTGMVACPPNGVDVFAQFNGKAVYKDFVQSFSTVEPAIDLTASSPLAFAWQIAGAPSGTP
ncbi:MAG: glycoside hydrolase family 9 protein [Terriglobales bacterium]